MSGHQKKYVGQLAKEIHITPEESRQFVDNTFLSDEVRNLIKQYVLREINAIEDGKSEPSFSRCGRKNVRPP